MADKSRSQGHFFHTHGSVHFLRRVRVHQASIQRLGYDLLRVHPLAVGFENFTIHNLSKSHSNLVAIYLWIYIYIYNILI